MVMGPACEMEAGQQKNVMPCWLCPENFDFGNDLSNLHALYITFKLERLCSKKYVINCKSK